MMASRPAEHWENRYREGDVPWDAGRPEPRITELVEGLAAPARLALDLGCGTGENTAWLAESGWCALGLDVAGAGLAEARRRHAGRAAFARADVRRPLPVSPGSAGIAIDRGCFHVLGPLDRHAFARHVAEAMAPGGWWVLLCGNADEARAAGEEGPPQLGAGAVVAPVEPFFALHRLEAARFTGADGRATHLAWRSVWRRRAEPSRDDAAATPG